MANPGVAIAQLPSRLPLRLLGNSGATVENVTVDPPEPYVAKTMTIRQHGEAHGPWLVYGYTTQEQLQQVYAGLTVTRDGPQAPQNARGVRGALRYDTDVPVCHVAQQPRAVPLLPHDILDVSQRRLCQPWPVCQHWRFSGTRPRIRQQQPDGCL